MSNLRLVSSLPITYTNAVYQPLATTLQNTQSTTITICLSRYSATQIDIRISNFDGDLTETSVGIHTIGY